MVNEVMRTRGTTRCVDALKKFVQWQLLMVERGHLAMEETSKNFLINLIGKIDDAQHNRELRSKFYAHFHVELAVAEV